MPQADDALMLSAESLCQPVVIDIDDNPDANSDIMDIDIAGHEYLESCMGNQERTQITQALISLQNKIESQHVALESSIAGSLKEVVVVVSHIAHQCDDLGIQLKELDTLLKTSAQQTGDPGPQCGLGNGDSQDGKANQDSWNVAAPKSPHSKRKSELQLCDLVLDVPVEGSSESAHETLGKIDTNRSDFPCVVSVRASENGLILREIWSLSSDISNPCGDAHSFGEAVIPDWRVQPLSCHIASSKEGADITYATVLTCMLHPHHGTRTIWNLLCIVAILYDVIMVPTSVFDYPKDTLMVVIPWIMTIFWTCDIGVTFRTAYFRGPELEVNAWRVATHYAKTWLTMDLLVLVLEWVGRLSDISTDSSVIVRSLRVWKNMKFLRLLKLGKVPCLLFLIEDYFTSGIAKLSFTMLKLCCVFLVSIHGITCCWYAIGKSSPAGWTSYYGPEIHSSRRFAFWYFVSCRWTLSQINGRTDTDESRTMTELVYTCIVAIAFAVILMALFLSSITATMMELSNAANSKFNTQRDVKKFIARHCVAPKLVAAIVAYVQETARFEDVNEIESRITSLIPNHLAIDLLYEVRRPLMTKSHYFFDLDVYHPRAMWTVSYSAARFVAAYRHEVIFDTGDVCNRMLFVSTGMLIYAALNSPFKMQNAMNQPAEKLQRHRVDSTRFGQFDNGDELAYGCVVSEPALWVLWQNQGTLTVARHSTVLAVDAIKFGESVCMSSFAKKNSLRYAQEYLNMLGRVSILSDLMRVEKL